MAAPIRRERKEIFFENAFRPIIVQFFEMVPIRRMKWEAHTITSQNLDIQTQIEVLNSTLRSELCKKYPPALSYRKAFVKKLLHVLEEYGVEICDEIYEVYSDLLQHNETGEDTLCYKTYTLDWATSDIISLQESVNMVSFGTTGLSTWQAAQHLSEWVIQNKQLFLNKNVLELGSGLGMTGLVTCKVCQIKSYTFTDLHKQVLELLAKNIDRNMSRGEPSSDKHVNTKDQSTESDMEINASSLHEKLPNMCSQSDSEGGISAIIKKVEEQSSSNCDIQSPGEKSDSTDTDQTNSEQDQTMCEDGDSPSLCSESWERHASFNTYLYRGSGRLRLAQLDWEHLDEHLVEHLSDTDIVLAAELYKGSGRLRLAQLDWEHLDEQFVEHLADTDIVLAADVVYDNRIIPHLVHTIKSLLCSSVGRQDPICAYLASTIRNEDTRDQFLINLSSSGLNYQQIEGPKLQLFHYDKSVPIEILKITVADI